MRFDIVTIFPELISHYFTQGIIAQGIKKELVEVKTWQLRDYGRGNYQQVDDRVFGGGAGMVFMFEPMAECVAAIQAAHAEAGITRERTCVIATSAQGETFTQPVANRLQEQFDAVIVLCGRYDGFDQRIIEELVDQEISLGKFVLSGGELPALCIVDAVARLIPGVLGKEESYQHDSFYNDDSLQFPQYTRPEVVNFDGRELGVPDVLLSGHHAEIEKWRQAQRRQS